MSIIKTMKEKIDQTLRRGWTTGACASAAVKAALEMLWGDEVLTTVSVILPRGEAPIFDLECYKRGSDWVEVGIKKDAGDDPDVTHGCIVNARVSESVSGVIFVGGEGVGKVTKPGLPIGVGEPAINPMPRKMMINLVNEMALKYKKNANIQITISIPGGADLAKKTWNPRLGIKGGLSILGTTGIVKPYSCSAWIASIHRGIDVARAANLKHVAGCTGSTSEATVQKVLGLSDYAMLDMGDFVGGMIKYLKKYPIDRVTIGGGIGKITKLAFGAIDLHSKRSQVDFSKLNSLCVSAGLADVSSANTALEALSIAGPKLATLVAEKALDSLTFMVKNDNIQISVIIVNRSGLVIAKVGI
jgi:cobalt-precorrin-5B (C1)-methyltransferase